MNTTAGFSQFEQQGGHLARMLVAQAPCGRYIKMRCCLGLRGRFNKTKEHANYRLNPTPGIGLGADFVRIFARRGLAWR